jgi:hypothetical protein
MNQGQERPLRILVVDDDQCDRRSVQRALGTVCTLCGHLPDHERKMLKDLGDKMSATFAGEMLISDLLAGTGTNQ